MRIGRVLVLCGLIVATLPDSARADGYLVPFVGANFGGEVVRPLNIALRDGNRAAIGATLGVMGAGVFGLELNMSYTANFYPPLLSNDDGGGNLVTLVPSLVLGIPLGGQRGFGFRPFVLAGAGLVRRDFDVGSLTSSLSQNDLAYTLGGGVMVFFTDHIGIRGDIRYFRNFRVDEFGLSSAEIERGTFDFSRAAGGVVFRF